MGYAFVTSNLVDMRREPSNRSERVNQLLFGETVRTSASHEGFVTITQRDGYSGWVSERFLEKSGRTEFDAGGSFVVIASTARIHEDSKRPADPFYVYYGTRLRGVTKRDGRFLISLASRRNIYLKASSVQPIIRGTAVTSGRILAEARRFLGVPYLWGGISPAGFDCSGFVRAVMSRFGIDLARDTKDQILQGEPVERKGIKSGDLVFFPGHVGFAIGRDRLIHASRGGGGVRINSLTPGTSDYRADLDKDYRTTRRILPCR